MTGLNMPLEYAAVLALACVAFGGAFVVAVLYAKGYFSPRTAPVRRPAGAPQAPPPAPRDALSVEAVINDHFEARAVVNATKDLLQRRLQMLEAGLQPPKPD